MEEKINHDAVKVPLNIKAPLIALITGSALGAVVGNLFRSTHGENAELLNKMNFQSKLIVVISLISSIILSTIVIVAFARKKDAQPFMSVEDFYGGLFVGFLVGYNGESWLQTGLSGTNPGGGTFAGH